MPAVQPGDKHGIVPVRDKALIGQEILKVHGISRKEIADRVGINPGHFWRIATGTVKSTKYAEKLNRVIGGMLGARGLSISKRDLVQPERFGYQVKVSSKEGRLDPKIIERIAKRKSKFESGLVRFKMRDAWISTSAIDLKNWQRAGEAIGMDQEIKRMEMGIPGVPKPPTVPWLPGLDYGLMGDLLGGSDERSAEAMEGLEIDESETGGELVLT